jgi:HK97 family phage portal protein
MNVTDRIRTWVSERVAPKAINESMSVPAQLIPFIESMASTGLSYSTLVSSYKSWVFIAVDKIAKTVATLPLNLYTYQRNGKVIRGSELKSAFQRDGLSRSKARLWLKQHDVERVLVEDHPVYELFNHPNDVQSRFQLWYDTTVKLEVGGQCLWYLPANRLGIPGEIWPLPLRSNGALSARVTSKGMQGWNYTDGTVNQTFSKEEGLWYLLQSPKNFYEPFSPLAAQTYPYDIDNYLMELQYYMFKNRAAPGTVLSTEQKLTQVQVQSLVDQINTQYAGTTRAGRPMILHSGLEPAGSVAMPLKDLVIESVAQEVQDKLLSAYGVPAGKVGLVKDVNRANAEALDKTFLQETIRPRCMLIEETLEKDLLPRYDDRLTADFDLPESSQRELDLQERKDNLASGLTTINEERAGLGLDEVTWGFEPWLGAGLLQPGEGGGEPPPPEKHWHGKGYSAKADTVAFSFDFEDPGVQKRLGDRVKLFSVEVTGTTWDEVSAVLREGFNEGLSTSAIADRVKASFDGFANYRANNIARTESVYSVSAADLEVAEQNELGETFLKYWICSRDNETRATHLAAETSYADGIPLDEPFSVGDDSMDAPGMGSLAEENCNCRCSIGYRPKDAKNWAYDESRWAAEAKANDRWFKGYERAFKRAVRKLFAKQEREVLRALSSEGERLKAHVNGWSLGKIRTHLKQTAAVAELLPAREQWVKQTADAFEPVYAYVIDSAGERRVQQLNTRSRR